MEQEEVRKFVPGNPERPEQTKVSKWQMVQELGTVELGTGQMAETTEANVVVAVAEGGTGNANSACQSNMTRQAKLLGKILGDRKLASVLIYIRSNNLIRIHRDCYNLYLAISLIFRMYVNRGLP